MTPKALEALKQIRTLKQYSPSQFPQTSLAETRILKNLNVADFLDVVTELALEADARQKTSVPRD